MPKATHPHPVGLSPLRTGSVPLPVCTPILALVGCESISPALAGSEAPAWGAPAPPSCPRPRSSGVSMVPTPSPCCTPLALEPEPTRGAASAACTVPAMGMARRPAPTEALLSWGQAAAAPEGPCLPGGWSAAPGLLVHQQLSSALRCSLSPFSWQDCPCLLDCPGLGSTQTRILVPADGAHRAPSASPPQTGLRKATGWACPAPDMVLCGRRAGGRL